MAYSPAFQVYPNDFLSDMNTISMSAEEIGAYWLLVMFCWKQEGLPNDMNTLAELARLPLEKFKEIWERRVSKCFELDEERQLFFNPRLLDEIEKQKQFREKKSRAGKKGMKNRWKDKPRDDNNVKSPGNSGVSDDNSAITPNNSSFSPSASPTSSASFTTSGSNEKNVNSSYVEEPITYSKKKSNEQFWAEIRAEPIYSHIDLDHEMVKIKYWASAKGRDVTQDLIINWLNKIQNPKDMMAGRYPPDRYLRRKSNVEAMRQSKLYFAARRAQIAKRVPQTIDLPYSPPENEIEST